MSDGTTESELMTGAIFGASYFPSSKAFNDSDVSKVVPNIKVIISASWKTVGTCPTQNILWQLQQILSITIFEIGHGWATP